VLETVSAASDSCQVLADWFKAVTQLVVMGRGPSADEATQWIRTDDSTQGVIVADLTYATRDVYQSEPLAVLMGDRPADDMLKRCAERFHATEPERRPLLLGAFLPRAAWPAWEAHHLPRPVPVLPLLLRSGLYRHQPNGPYPTTGTLMVLLAAALEKEVIACGMDLCQASDTRQDQPRPLPAPHAFETELACLRHAMTQATSRVQIHGQANRWLM
jgi:hypothetical protein